MTEQQHIATDTQKLLAAVEASIREKVLAEIGKQEPKRPDARLLNAKQAGEYLGRTEGSIRQLIHKKFLPVIRWGRAVRIDIRDLDRLIENNRM